MSIVPLEIPALKPNLLQPPVPQTPSKVIQDKISRFNYPGSDIVLRSRDSYNFPMSKLNIVICSPVLRTLIESVSNSSDVPNGEEQKAPHLPVVEIPESKETLPPPHFHFPRHSSPSPHPRENHGALSRGSEI
jgi:hypothetical protein